MKDLLLETADQDDRYSEMTRTLAGAFLAEKESGDETAARTGYLDCIEYAESFGPFAEVYEAIGYMGLSRLHEKQGLQKEANSYERKASRLTNYAFILDEQTGSR